ncbi:YdcF family protein [Bacillus sp. APMAM]|nr:YdcF family protein [Bacillus sp. APMAM]RTZ53674.1 YdcF family protein [Bacillus sp. SAJ1]
MLISEIQIDTLSDQQITKFMFDGMQDDGCNGDLILVFGSRSGHRVKKAADLFNQNRAPLILVSGSERRWGEGEVSEAIWMRDYLIKLGIPADNILLETQADNTTENVIGSAFVMQKKIGLHMIKRILVVSAPFHVKRCHLTLKTYMPTWIEYTICPDDRQFGQWNNWNSDPKTKALVLNELNSIIKYVKMGILRDLEMDDI